MGQRIGCFYVQFRHRGLNSGFCSLLLLLVFGADIVMGQYPDLIVNDAALNPRLSFEKFPSSDCAVTEGCTVEGTRRLLRFTAETRNAGNADLFLGDPSTNPLYSFSPCHGHYHLNGFAEYRLLDDSGAVAVGRKQGFCLLDSLRWDPDANPLQVYTCSYQGIQAGWADVYFYSLDCQWIDVTDVPPGLYLLEVEVNPGRILVESDTSNNVANALIEIDDGSPPANDNCAAAILVSDGTTAFSNVNATTDGPPEPGSCTFFGNYLIPADIWYRYRSSCTGTVTASLCGSSFDTKMAIYGSSCPVSTGTVKACNDDACGFQSEVKFSARKGEEFLIRIGGFNGAQGSGILTLSCAPKNRKR